MKLPIMCSEILLWYVLQLRNPTHPSCSIPTSIHCLSTLLREPYVRTLFVQADGIKLLIPLISPASTQQSIQVITWLYTSRMKISWRRFVSLGLSSLITDNRHKLVPLSTSPIGVHFCYFLCSSFMKLVSASGFYPFMMLQWIICPPQELCQDL